jgi:hypothetical protein
MPRKRNRLSEYVIPAIDPKDRNAVDDRARVRHALVDFDELALLSDENRKQLVEDLVRAICCARGGIKAGKHGLSDKAAAQQIFISDVGRALERAGLPATRWRKTYDGDGGPDISAPESFYFRLVRALGDVFGIPVPKDLKLAGQRASEIQYGAMSPAMKATQLAEQIVQGRQRLRDLTVRLKTCAAQGTATPKTAYEDLPLESRLLALGLSSANTLAGSPFAR